MRSYKIFNLVELNLTILRKTLCPKLIQLCQTLLFLAAQAPSSSSIIPASKTWIGV